MLSWSLHFRLECLSRHQPICLPWCGNAKSCCTAIGSIWWNAEGCHECRDLSRCSEEEPKEEPKSCGPCVLEVCASDLNDCPDTNPFACLNGKTKSGSTAIEHIWLNPKVCHECCDLSHCPPGEGQASKVDPATHWRPDQVLPSKVIPLYGSLIFLLSLCCL
jgi:hypothetical protein